AVVANSPTTGMTPVMPRILEEPVTFGSRRLSQIFQVTKSKGQFIELYEEPRQQIMPGLKREPYTSWLNVNFKVELLCDMKRDELHSLAVCLSSGEIVSSFFQKAQALAFTPKLPPHV